MPSNLCPDCGKPLTRLKHGSFSILKCTCGYQYNEKTGATLHGANNEATYMVLCPHCLGKVRLDNNIPLGSKASCPFCSHTFTVPMQPDPTMRMNVICPQCQAKNSVPANKGTLKVHCGVCGKDFFYKSGTWPSKTKSAPKSQGNNWLVNCPKCGDPLTIEKGGGTTMITAPKCGHTFYFDCDNGCFPTIAKDGSINGKWMYPCPVCGHIWRVEKSSGVIHFSCECGKELAVDRSNGKPVHSTSAPSSPIFLKDEDCWLTRCPHCGQTATVEKGGTMMEVTHHSCGKTWYFDGKHGKHLPMMKDRSVGGHWVYHCPKCDQLWFLQQNTGIADTTCGCGHRFAYDTDAGCLAKTQSAAQPKKQTAPKQTQQTQQPKQQTPPKQTYQAPPKQTYQQPKQPQPAPQPKPAGKPCRTITIHRDVHAYKEWDLKGLENMFRDKFPVRIVLDDEEQGNLAAKETMTLHVDSSEHTIRYNLLAPKYTIPAGTDNYLVYYFRDHFLIGPEVDSFRDRLTQAVLQIFRGVGIKERILDSNNRNHNICISIDEKGIRLYWQVEKTKGLKQWATGEDEENISYAQLGLTPPTGNNLPGSYWGFISDWVEAAIETDPTVDMERYMGGFTFRKKHNLF